MREELHHRDEEFRGIPGAQPRKITKGAKPSWQQKLMGGLAKDKDGKYRPAPEKEVDIERFTAAYAALRGLWRQRTPDCLLRAVYARGGLLDRLLEACHPKLKPEFYTEAMALRRQAKVDLADKPDDIFLDRKRNPDGTHRALVLENKTKAGKLSKGQRATDEKLGGMHVTRSTAAVKAAIDAFCDHQPIPTEPNI